VKETIKVINNIHKKCSIKKKNESNKQTNALSKTNRVNQRKTMWGVVAIKIMYLRVLVCDY